MTESTRHTRKFNKVAVPTIGSVMPHHTPADNISIHSLHSYKYCGRESEKKIAGRGCHSLPIYYGYYPRFRVEIGAYYSP